jgi:uncharacterized protein YuzE
MSTPQPLRVEYDSEADAAYIYFVEEIRAGGVARTVPVDGEDPWMVNLDVDVEGRIVGLEGLDASKRLPPGLLAPRP